MVESLHVHGSSRSLICSRDGKARYDPLQSEPLDVISLVSACRRVGLFFDLWQHDQVRLLEMVELEHERCVHPLRGLLTPPETVTNNNAPMRRKAALQEGTRVKARFSDKFRSHYLSYDHNGEKYVDKGQVWHNAIIQTENGDGTFIIKWENGHGDTDVVKTAEDLLPFYSDEDRDGERYLLQSFGCSKGVNLKSSFSLLILALLVAFAPELPLAGSHESDLDICPEESSDSNAKSSFCSLILAAIPEVEAGVGLKVGILSMLLCFLLGFMIFPACYYICNLCCPVRAKKCRRSFLNIVLDPLRIEGLQTVYGLVESVVLWFAASAFLSVICCAVLLLQVGLVPLGIVVVRHMLTFSNLVFGEDIGMQQVRMARFIAILTAHAEKSRIEIDKPTLRAELGMLLQQPFNAGTIELSLPFITLLASLLNVSEADSCRLHRFLVKRAYAEFKHSPKSLAQLEHRYDVIVNVFEGTCKVPGISHEVGRWHSSGRPLPWHFAVSATAADMVEKELLDLRMKPGAGCFTWRSTRTGLWHNPESADPSYTKHVFKQISLNQRKHDLMLHDIALHDHWTDNDLDEVKAFLRAGADPNFRLSGSYTSLYRACYTGKLEIAKLLIEFKGDVNAKTNSKETPLTCTSIRFAGIKEALIEFVKLRGLEIDTT